MFRDGEGIPTTLSESQKAKPTFAATRTQERDDVPRIQVQPVPAPHAPVLPDQGNIRPRPLQQQQAVSVSRQGPAQAAATREAQKPAPRQNAVTTARRTVEHTGTSVVSTSLMCRKNALMHAGC